MPRLCNTDGELRYLDFLMESQWATESDVESGSPTFPSPWSFFKGLGNTFMNDFGRTSMDIFALVEHTLLHELTHSKAVGEPQANSLVKESYGWDNCLKAKSAKNSGMASFRIMYSYVILIVVQTPLHSLRLVAS